MSRRAIILFLCTAMLLPFALFACNSAEQALITDETHEATQEETEVQKPKESETEESIMVNEKFVITKANQDKLKILCTAEAGSKARAAADDLRAYIRRMTGWNIKIIGDHIETEGIMYITVGASEITEALGYETVSGYPGRESVTVSQRDSHLVLMGNDDGSYNGTQYAVNLLLERLGCGWFGTDELWTVVPTLECLDLRVGDLYLDFTPRFSSAETEQTHPRPDDQPGLERLR